jgi:hypothetical protein
MAFSVDYLWNCPGCGCENGPNCQNIPNLRSFDRFSSIFPLIFSGRGGSGDPWGSLKVAKVARGLKVESR